MSNVDTSIYGNIRQFKYESPLEREDKLANREMRDLQLEGARRQFSLEDDISGALSETGGDLGKASQVLAQRGRGQAALQLRDKATSQEKAQLDMKLKLMEGAASDGIAMDAAYRDALAKAGGDQAKAVAAVQPIYAEVRTRWAGMGHQLPESFDPVKNLAGIGQAKEVANYLKGITPPPSDLGKLLAERDALPAGDPRRAAYDDAIGKKTSDQTELSRLMRERDKLPEGSPERAKYDAVLKDYKAGRGDTNVQVNTGPMGLTKPAATKVDEDLLGMTKSLMQLDQINTQFKPEYQRFMDKAGFAALKVKDSSVGLNNKEKADLTAYSQYRRNAVNSMNEYIKSITGAAMSEPEARRILAGMPKVGDGIFDGDSPTEFKAKLDDAMKSTKMAVARLSYIKRNGLSLEDGKGNAVVPLERMPSVINERGKAIEDELKKTQPDADAKALQRAVRRQLSLEFGLSAD